MSAARSGLLLFAHGARDPNWALPFEAVLRRVREQAPGIAVSLSFLEFMAPSLLEAGGALAAAGCTRVAIVPMFLGAGGHVRKDLPALIETLRHTHPQVAWTLQPSIGEAPGVIEAMATAALRGADIAHIP